MSPTKPGTPGEVTDGVRNYWNQQASRYDRGIQWVERFILDDSRTWACSRAGGSTLEVAVGTGLNLPLYSKDVRLTGIDLSPGMLEIARRRAERLDRPVDLREADAQRLPFDDGEFDTVVSTISLCSVPDEHATVAEMRRVLRPGGRLVLVDHVRPTSRPVRWLLTAVQWVTDRLMPRACEHYLRRPLETVVAYGFTLEESQRFKGGAIERLVARK